MTIHAPQAVYLVLVAFNLVAAAVNDGRPKKPGIQRFSHTLVGSAIMFALLLSGGFFAQPA